MYSGTPFDLTGKTAIVTGGAGFLGREFCKALGSAGAVVACADRDAAGLPEAEKQIETAVPGMALHTVAVDITDAGSIQDCVSAMVDRQGRIDILVNSAAIDARFDKAAPVSEMTRFTEFSRDLWEASLRVNLTGTFLMTQAVCRVMEEEGKGSIINLGSNYGLVGPDQRIYRKKGEPEQAYKPPDYPVCKSGIIGFTKYLAAYYAGTKIRVNVLTPSGVFNDHDDEFSRQYASRTILRRMSEKNEFWGGLIFLASDASSYMTGANLVMDGGWTAL